MMKTNKTTKTISKAMIAIAMAGGMMMTGATSANAWYWDPEFSQDADGRVNMFKHDFLGMSQQDSTIDWQPGEYWGYGRGEWVPEPGDDLSNPPSDDVVSYTAGCGGHFDLDNDGVPIISSFIPMSSSNPAFTGTISAAEGGDADGASVVSMRLASTNQVLDLPQLGWQYMNDLRVQANQFDNNCSWSLGFHGRVPASQMTPYNDTPLASGKWSVGLGALGNDTGTYDWTLYREWFWCGVAPFDSWSKQIDQGDGTYIIKYRDAKKVGGPSQGWSACEFTYREEGPFSYGGSNQDPVKPPSGTVTGGNQVITGPNYGAVKPAKRIFKGKYKGVTVKRMYVQRDGKWSNTDVKKFQNKIQKVAKAKWVKKQQKRS